MTISKKAWNNYITRLRVVSDEAGKKFGEYFASISDPLSEAGRKALISYAFVIGRDYGEAAAELACEMYDAMIAAAGLEMGKPAGWKDPAEPARTATYAEAAKTVNGVLKTTLNAEEIAGAVSRLVKQAGVDTTMQNAKRDGAEMAWVPSGDTCAFCITLASRGWQEASNIAAKNGHAEHIHSNCDCTYAVRFNRDTNVAGYNDANYKRIYDSADGNTSKEKINAMRREFYKMNKEEINKQKRDAYEKRKELESSAAGEMEV